MKESAVEKYLHEQVELAGGTTRKWTCPGRRNVPDRIVIWPRNVLLSSGVAHPTVIHFVETKAPGKKVRSGQLREHARLRKLGCKVFTLDTKEKARVYVGIYR